MRMDSVNRWTNSRGAKNIPRFERTRSSAFSKLWNRSRWILRRFWFKLTALEHDTLKLMPEMVESTITCIPQLTILISKKIISRTVWATNKWSTPSDRARQVALEKLSRWSRCQLCLVRSVHQKRTERNLFQKSKCHSFKKKKRSRKIGTRSKRDWPVFLECVPEKLERFFFLKKGHSLFWNAFPSVLFYEHFSLDSYIFLLFRKSWQIFRINITYY
jgi:hypothetical protein